MPKQSTARDPATSRDRWAIPISRFAERRLTDIISATAPTGRAVSSLTAIGVTMMNMGNDETACLETHLSQVARKLRKTERTIARAVAWFESQGLLRRAPLDPGVDRLGRRIDVSGQGWIYQWLPPVADRKVKLSCTLRRTPTWATGAKRADRAVHPDDRAQLEQLEHETSQAETAPPPAPAGPLAEDTRAAPPPVTSARASTPATAAPTAVAGEVPLASPSSSSAAPPSSRPAPVSAEQLAPTDARRLWLEAHAAWRADVFDVHTRGRAPAASSWPTLLEFAHQFSSAERAEAVALACYHWPSVASERVRSVGYPLGWIEHDLATLEPKVRADLKRRAARAARVAQRPPVAPAAPRGGLAEHARAAREAVAALTTRAA